MFCSACGTEAPVGVGTCPDCGAQLPQSCANCQANLPLGARFCPFCGKPIETTTKAQPTLGHAVGERKQVTVLFADFCGFTSFAHKRDAEEVRDFVTAAWAKLDEIIA